MDHRTSAKEPFICIHGDVSMRLRICSICLLFDLLASGRELSLIISNTHMPYLMPLVLSTAFRSRLTELSPIKLKPGLLGNAPIPMGAIAVCDYEGRFTYFATRYIGSMHDSLAFKMCGLNWNTTTFPMLLTP